MTVETCPHYLVFEAEEIADGATQFKCCPPIREAGNREELWAGAGARRHRLRRLRPLAVHRRAQAARRAATSAPPGAASPSLQIGLPAVWTEARAARAHAGRRGALDGRSGPPSSPGCTHKGRIERRLPTPTSSSFAPDDAFVVDPTPLHHRNPVTPYAGRALAGVVRSTWLRGRRVTGDEPRGDA